MQLTLEVVSPNGASMGANRKRVVGPEGVQIGRSKENDWVIPDQYISRKNACIRYVNGAFYIEGVGRNPLALNDVSNVVANNEPFLLRNGDRFFLDQFEFSVTIGSGQQQHVSIPEDPFAEPAHRSAPVDFGISAAESDRTENLDPLDVLGGQTTRPPPAPRHVELEQRPILEEHYSPPEIVRAPDNKIPDVWDRSQISIIDPPKPSNRSATIDFDPFSQEPPSVAKSAIPDAWNPPPVERATHRPPARPTPPMPKVPTPPRAPATPPKTIRRPDDVKTAAMVPPVARQAPPSAPPAPTSDASLSIEALLRSAGVSGHMPPEIAGELGEVFRIVVQGLMDVLQSRAEIKSQLRMTLTRIESSENNPLKFSPNVDAALHTLFVERNRGYLPTVRAFEEAVADIRNHQLAVLQGMRVAFESMLEEFDPQKIESELEEHSKGSLLAVGMKGRFRDYYARRFERMTRDKEDAFNELFGDKFAQAYEQQMTRLKATGRASGK
jgi:type VI secretion system FHA domain protein